MFIFSARMSSEMKNLKTSSQACRKVEIKEIFKNGFVMDRRSEKQKEGWVW